MSNQSLKFRYRADIDGLRAIAVIGVVLFHAGLGVGGGFAGVDVFFVISGFLITSLILRDLHRGSFSIVAFWERRARRIFPALAVVVIATLIVGWFLMLPFGYQILGQSTVALTVFASNIQFWRTTSYFDPTAEENPLLHTWSLSVEEQFYLVVPLLLYLVFKYGKDKWVGILLGMGILASLVGAELWLRRDASGAFYLLPSRAWELGAGSLLAMARPVSSPRLRGFLGWLGLALILFTFFAYDAHTAFPGVAAIPPVLGTVLLIWSGMSYEEEVTFRGVNRLLATKGLVAIGLMSYSFYLWHWPFFAFHRYLFSHAPDVSLAIAYILIALVLSALSLRFVEQPFRKRNLISTRKYVFVLTGAISVLVMIVGISLWRTRGVPSRMPTVVAEYDAVKGNVKFKSAEPIRDEEVGFVGLGAKLGADIDYLGAKNKPCRVMIWGDSHAGVLLHVIDEICNAHGVSAIAVREGGVAPVFSYSGVDYTRRPNRARLAYANALMKYAQEMSQTGELQKVLLAFRWSYYIDTPHRLADDPLPKAGFPDALIGTIQSLENMGLQVSVLLEVPIFHQHVPKAVALHHWRGWPLPRLTKQQHQERQQSYEPLIQRLHTETPNVNLIDAAPYLISEKGEVEFLDNKGVLLYRDEHHLTKTGTMRLKPLFEKLLLR